MFELTMLPPDLISALDWQLVLPALAIPAGLALPAVARRSGSRWLRWRLKSLPHAEYEVLHRLPLPVGPDRDRVEHVVLSRQGVFLVQVVNRTGHLLGAAQDKMWTHKLPGGDQPFHNPLRLGIRRATALAAMMGIDPRVLQPVVVFTGKCSFDSPMPSNVTDARGCLSYVRAQQAVLVQDDELARIRARLMAGFSETRRDAEDRVVERKPKPDLTDDRVAIAVPDGQLAEAVCPRCGGALGAYSYKTGHRAGQMFSGCTRFPSCDYRAYPVRKTVRKSEPRPALPAYPAPAAPVSRFGEPSVFAS